MKYYVGYGVNKTAAFAMAYCNAEKNHAPVSVLDMACDCAESWFNHESDFTYSVKVEYIALNTKAGYPDYQCTISVELV